MLLSRRVCGWLNWRSPNGKPCEVDCRKALLKLDRRDIIELPKAKSFPIVMRTDLLTLKYDSGSVVHLLIK